MLCISAGVPGVVTGDLNIKPDGSVGIGVDPQSKLDVDGRLRIRNSSNTAGVWFDGTETFNRAFVGIINEDHAGIYGAGGAGWNFAMNVNNGYTGIGTSAPTAKLDVNGSLRLRSGTPMAGSVLTSIDASGNAVWKEDRVAFKAYGMSSGRNVIADYTSVRVHFGGKKFDLGNDYNLLAANATPDGNSSAFTVPVQGVYHFDLNVHIDPLGISQDIEAASITLILKRNGVESTLAQQKAARIFQEVGGAEVPDGGLFSLSTTEYLQAGDKVFVTVFHNTGTTATIDYGELTWFSGFLVKAD
jgi:hypothetical protein